MQKSDSITNITKAIISVMHEVKGIEKSMTVGTGSNSYKGVPDQEVKKIIGDSMAKNGLAILPIGVSPKTQVDRWEETYNGQAKQKQSVFTEVTTNYLLTHTSGEFIELSGYGHGVDSQDKGAGKATTYALKYTLLYLFLVPTGKIDDADATHSDTIETPKKKGSKDEQIFYGDWEKNISKCKTEADLTSLWVKNKATCEGDTRLIEMFSSKKKQLTNGVHA